MRVVISRSLRLVAGLAGLLLGTGAMAHTGADAGAHHAATFVAGMLLSTVLLRIAALAGLGSALHMRGVWWPRITGAAVAVLGGALMLQLV